MANPFVKAWLYFKALGNAKLDEIADPKVQIQQALSDMQTQHQQLVQQAASVIANQRDIEIKLSRNIEEVEKFKSQATQALVLADKARAAGKEDEALRYESTAKTFADHLVTSEQATEDLKNLHVAASSASAQARKAVENNAALLQAKMAERNRLLSQLEQAKMQETVADSMQAISGMKLNDNSPSMDEIRDKIEGRYSQALGRQELATNGAAGRMLEVEKASLDMAGENRLAELRASLNPQITDK